MILTRLLALSLSFACALVLAAPIVLAAGSGSSTTKADAYKEAEDAIDDEEYAKAIPLLEKSIAEKGGYADAYNLLGFAHRKLGDKQKGMDFYMKALAKEPAHLGANEYLGELYLELKDLPKAEERLAVLKSACGSCDEFDDLEEAIEEFKQAAQ
jgi:tetratricopeptide (TPR) repeat protein